MNSKQLQYFLKVSELKSISGAARALDVAQPSISLQLENLEHELSAILFDRNHKGVQLTDAGELFLKHAESILRQIQISKQDVNQLVSEPSGTLKIGMTQPIGNIIAVPLFSMIKKIYPKIELDLYTGLSYSIINQLKSGDIDLAITSPDGSDYSDLASMHLIRESLYIITSGKHKTKFSDRNEINFVELDKEEVITTSKKDSLGYTLFNYEKEHDIEIVHKPSYGQLMTTLQYVSDGHGILLSSSSAFYQLVKSEQIKPIKVVNPELFRDVFIYTHLERPSTNLIRKVIPLIFETTKKEVLNGNWKGSMKSDVKSGC